MSGTIARSSDPITSHEAAVKICENGTRAHMRMVAWKVLCNNPGSTARELDSYAGYADGGIRKRLGDLREQKRAYVHGRRQCRITGNNAQVWWPVTEEKQQELF